MTKKIKVMMVDDEERFRKATSTILTKRGFETTIAASGEEALRMLRQAPQDVVVLDVKMEGMDGHAALKEIKKIAPETQVIMLTGHGSLESAVSSKELAAFDYLSKPCDIDLLAAKINEAHAVGQSKAERKEKKVKDIMTGIEDYSSVTVDATVRQAVETLFKSMSDLVSSSRLREAGHRSLLVFDERQRLRGLLSIKDLIRSVRPYYLSVPQSTMAQSVRFSHVFSGNQYGLFSIQLKALAEKKVGELDLEPPAMIDAEANLMDVAEVLYQTQKTRLVVTSGSKVIGILREQDLFFEIVHIINQ